MGQCFLYGNGGESSLAYDIVCQTAEPAKKEGRIWVKSAVAMTALEWANDPWTSGAVGRVDIGGTPGGDNPSSANSTIMVFNVKRAGITESMKVTPALCRQVQGSTGNWVNVDAYVCHSDTWVQFSYSWDGTLFYAGEQYEEYTGGWTVSGLSTSTSPILQGSSYSGDVSITTKSVVDLTRFSTLKFTGYGHGSNSGGNYDASWGVQSNSGSTLASGTYNRHSDATSSIDISSISESCYIKFWVSGSRGNEISITKVWLE